MGISEELERIEWTAQIFMEITDAGCLYHCKITTNLIIKQTLLKKIEINIFA